MAHQTVDTTKEQAREVTGTAADETRSLAGSAQQEAQQVAQTAKEQIATVAGEAQEQASHLMAEATSQLRGQADTQTQRAAELLRGYNAELEALADGRPQDAPHLVERLHQTSSRISTLADRVETGGSQGVIEDLEQFARRRPGLFLAGAALAGFAVTRIMRTARQAPAAAPRRLPAARTGTEPTAPVPAGPTTDITETAERPLAPSTGPGQEVIEVHPDGHITSAQGR